MLKIFKHIFPRNSWWNFKEFFGPLNLKLRLLLFRLGFNRIYYFLFMLFSYSLFVTSFRATVFLTNLDRLRHRTVSPPSSYRTPPYPPFFTLFGLKKRWVRWGTVGYDTVTVGVRYGDAKGLNSLEILYETISSLEKWFSTYFLFIKCQGVQINYISRLILNILKVKILNFQSFDLFISRNKKYSCKIK